MQSAFGIVLFVVIAVAAVVALASVLGRSRLYDQIGRGGLSVRDDEDARATGSSGAAAPAAGAGEREAEIRQMLEAGNLRRRARGEHEVDVDAELRRLTAPSVDAELRREIRTLVLARNERRARSGQPPLDIDAEVERQVRDLAG